MNDRFGPWSSALGDGASLHLSTFWKHRLNLLESTRSAPAALTRRDCLKLGAAGVAACALPTFRAASAIGPAESKAVASGKIYVIAHFKPREKDQEPFTGVIAVDPMTAKWEKVTEFNERLRVSRDGRKIALIRSSVIGADGHQVKGSGVWTMAADGKGDRQKVTDFGGVTSWSPDAKQLIVGKWLSKPQDDFMLHETWRFNADGTGATKLPIPKTDEVDDWSPDGRWFVTVSDRHPPHGRGYQLYVMHPDGTNERRLTEGKGLNVYPRFSPDGRTIVYLHQDRGGNSLWVVNVDGTGRRRILGEEGDWSPHTVVWSPDGKSLLFSMDKWTRDGKGPKSLDQSSFPRLTIIDADGTNRRPLELPLAGWINSIDWR